MADDDKPVKTSRPRKKKAEKLDIKALLIDDNYEFFQSLAPTLGERIHMDYAPDAFTAFQLIKKGAFDVIICDVRMPALDGMSLLQEFNKRRISIPMVMITGELDQELASQALQHGAYNILEKPFAIDELLAKLKLAIDLHQKDEVVHLEEQDKAFIYNSLKVHYYDVEKIIRMIELVQLPVSLIYQEITKKEQTGKCMFDDLQSLKSYRA